MSWCWLSDVHHANDAATMGKWALTPLGSLGSGVCKRESGRAGQTTTLLLPTAKSD